MKTIWSRRDFLFQSGGGIAGLALAQLLNQQGMLAAEVTDLGQCGAPAVGLNPLAPKAPHFKARAKSVISLFMSGGPSQVDTFDPKPALEQYAGNDLEADVRVRQCCAGPILARTFQFHK